MTPTGSETLAEMVVPDWESCNDRTPPQEIVEIADAHPGYGVCWAWRPPEGYKRKAWSKEAKARNRIRRLRERMERRYPLFAEQFIREAIEARPAYYAAEDVFYDREND